MTTKKDSEDVLEGPGFKMVRRGRNLELRTHRSAEEQRELFRRMKESRPKILAEIESKTAELVEIIHKYSSLDLVANLFLRNSMQDPNEYKESESTLRPHWIEHAAVLELKDSCYLLRPALLVDPADVERANVLLEEIFMQTTFYYMAENVDPDKTGPPSAMDEVRFFTLLHGMSVRSPAYASHWRDVLLGLFEHGSGSERLSSTYDLDVRTAVAIVDAIENHITGTLMKRTEQARKERNDVLDRLKDYTATGVYKGEEHKKELLDRLRNMRAKQAKRYLNNCLLAWVHVALGSTFSFAADDIAVLAGVRVERARAFLSEVSVNFGATPAHEVLPSPVNILHARPVVQYEASYFCPAPHLLPWSIKPLFERLLAGTPSWNAYQKQRSSYLVSTALKYITDLLPGAVVYQNLSYPLKDGGETELDGLVLFDRYAFLVEGKAGTLSAAARRGGQLKIKSQLEALVGDAIDQVVRASEYVRSNDAPVFGLGAGGVVTLDKTRFSEQVLVTITLEALDIFTADIDQLRKIGAVTAGEIAWSVALTDLRCISEILRRSFEFTHFMRWRRSILADASLSGGKDELNWLAIYLKEGPILPPAPGYDFRQFTSYTDDFDAYFFHKEGTRTAPAARPEQPLPRPMDRLCDALISARRYGFTKPGEFLLDLSFDERKDFAQKLVELAFTEKKQRRSEFALATNSMVVKVVARNLSETDLNVEANAIRDLSGKRVLVMAVTALPDWQVYGWAVVS